MSSSTVEAHWEAEGLDCAVLVIELGGGHRHRCGYVRVPEDHPFFGLDETDEAPGPPAQVEGRTVGDAGMAGMLAMLGGDLDGYASTVQGHVAVHGGLTFANRVPNRDLPVGWWFGFDCNHAGDTWDRWPLDAVRGETERLARQLAAIGVMADV